MTGPAPSECAFAAPLDLATDANLPLAYFYYAGTSSLLGWNIILTFTHAFDCDVFDGRVWLGSGWPFWSTFCYSVALNVVQGLLSSRTVASRLSNGVRLVWGSVGVAAGVVGLLVCRFYDFGGQDEGLAVALGFASLVGASSAIFQSSVFGMAAAISPRLTQAAMTGQGLAGVLSAVVACVWKFAHNDATLLAASLMLSAAFVLLGVPLFCCCVRRNPHVQQLLEAPIKLPSASQSPQLAGGGNRLSHDTVSALRSSPPPWPPSPAPGPARGAGGLAGTSPPLGGSPGGLLASSPGTSVRSVASTPQLMRRRSSVTILKENAWPQALTVCLVFTVTFTVFPGVVSRWKPSVAGQDRVTLLIATFQLLDVLGRAAPEVSALKIRRGPVVSLLAMIRLLFVPAFIILEREASEDWTRGALLQYALMVIFAFSNGYVSTLSMMLGPGQRGLDQDEQEPVGTMMSFFLAFGIFLGSLLALPTQAGLVAAPTCQAAAAARGLAQ